MRTLVEHLIEDFGSSEDKGGKPEAVPLEKRIDGILLVDDMRKERQMEDGEVKRMEYLPRFLVILVFWCVSLAP